MEPDEKACPFCAETIKAAAIVCKHCGRDLPLSDAHAAPGGNPIALLPMEQQRKVRALGITWQQERWVVDGCYFSDLARAIEFGERPRTPPVPTAQTRKTNPALNLLWLLLMMGGLFLIWALLRTPGPNEDAKWNARMAIEQCWKDQARKSLDPDAARFVAPARHQIVLTLTTPFGVIGA